MHLTAGSRVPACLANYGADVPNGSLLCWHRPQSRPRPLTGDIQVQDGEVIVLTFLPSDVFAPDSDATGAGPHPPDDDSHAADGDGDGHHGRRLGVGGAADQGAPGSGDSLATGPRDRCARGCCRRCHFFPT